MSAVEQAAETIRKVTDLWDEPLDDIHDIPQIVQALGAAGLLATEEHDRQVKAKALRWAADHLSDGMSYDDIDAINSWAAVVVCSGIIRKRADQIEAGDHDGE